MDERPPAGEEKGQQPEKPGTAMDYTATVIYNSPFGSWCVDMVALKPFRGWRYDLDVVGDPASVLSPPYDLITPEIQQSLRELSPYNVVHLEAGEGLDWNAPAQDQYSGTASLFQEWTGKGVLRRDAEPCCYLSRQEFQHQGQQRSRLGLTACLRLEEYESQLVLPHEYTELPAIRDRVSLMDACGANFSPIMALYQDPEAVLAPIFHQAMAEPPILDVRDDLGQSSTLWRMMDPGILESISRFFQDRVVFLADGHHRYAAALQYRVERLDRETSTVPSDRAYNYVMMTLIGFDDSGLLVLPYHRILGGLSREKYTQVQERLHQIFEVSPVVSEGRDSADALVQEVARRGMDGHAMGMVEPENQGSSLLTLRPGLDWKNWGPLGVSEAWILEEQVLKPVLGGTTLDHLGYIHDHREAVQLVASGARQAAFLLKPFPMDQFQEIVGKGQRLPRKSTFFYPKLPTGLVINQLEGAL